MWHKMVVQFPQLSIKQDPELASPKNGKIQTQLNAGLAEPAASERVRLSCQSQKKTVYTGLVLNIGAKIKLLPTAHTSYFVLKSALTLSPQKIYFSR